MGFEEANGQPSANPLSRTKHYLPVAVAILGLVLLAVGVMQTFLR